MLMFYGQMWSYMNTSVFIQKSIHVPDRLYCVLSLKSSMEKADDESDTDNQYSDIWQSCDSLGISLCNFLFIQMVQTYSNLIIIILKGLRGTTGKCATGKTHESKIILTQL